MTKTSQNSTMNDVSTAPRDFIYVSVRSNRHASPAVDMRALNATSDMLHKTLEDLDGACG